MGPSLAGFWGLILSPFHRVGVKKHDFAHNKFGGEIISLLGEESRSTLYIYLEISPSIETCI